MALNATSASVAVQIALSFAAVPFLGLEGAAIATSVTTTLWVMHMCYLAKKATGMASNPFDYLMQIKKKI